MIRTQYIFKPSTVQNKPVQHLHVCLNYINLKNKWGLHNNLLGSWVSTWCQCHGLYICLKTMYKNLPCSKSDRNTSAEMVDVQWLSQPYHYIPEPRLGSTKWRLPMNTPAFHTGNRWSICLIWISKKFFHLSCILLRKLLPWWGGWSHAEILIWVVAL